MESSFKRDGIFIYGLLLVKLRLRWVASSFQNLWPLYLSIRLDSGGLPALLLPRILLLTSVSTATTVIVSR